MKVVIYSTEGEQKKLLEGNYSYAEGESRQENKPAFFISVYGENSFEIHFIAERVEEIDELIGNLQEIRDNFGYAKKTVRK